MTQSAIVCCDTTLSSSRDAIHPRSQKKKRKKAPKSFQPRFLFLFKSSARKGNRFFCVTSPQGYICDVEADEIKMNKELDITGLVIVNSLKYFWLTEAGLIVIVPRVGVLYPVQRMSGMFK